MIICDPPVVRWRVAPKPADYSQRREGVWKRRIADPAATVRPMVPEFVDPDCFQIDEHTAPEIIARIPDGIGPAYLVPLPPPATARTPVPGTLALMAAGVYWITKRRMKRTT